MINLAALTSGLFLTVPIVTSQACNPGLEYFELEGFLTAATVSDGPLAAPPAFLFQQEVRPHCEQRLQLQAIPNTNACLPLSLIPGLYRVLFCSDPCTGCTCCKGPAGVRCHRLMFANMASLEPHRCVVPCGWLHGIHHT